MSSDGGTVFAAGLSQVAEDTFQSVTIAYDAATGAERWRSTSPEPNLYGEQIAVSPDGSRVFVTGSFVADPGFTPREYATVAYDASNGDELWSRTYVGRRGGPAAPVAIGVASDSSTVYVTGGSAGVSTHQDYMTIAYDASNGSLMWIRRLNDPHDADDVATDLAVSPDGSSVVVTGTSGGSFNRERATTVSYDASSGATLWRRSQRARSPLLALGSSRVFVAGTGMHRVVARAAAYSLGSGKRRWSFRGPIDSVTGVAVDADGGHLFLSGIRVRHPGGEDFLTLGLRTSDGHELWRRGVRGPRRDAGYDVAVAGSSAIVTGVSASANGYDMLTLAYEGATGASVWRRLYDGPGHGNDVPTSIAVAPDGTNVFVTGWSAGTAGSRDLGTIAYSA